MTYQETKKETLKILKNVLLFIFYSIAVIPLLIFYLIKKQVRSKQETNKKK